MPSIVRDCAAAVASLAGHGWFRSEAALTSELVEDLRKANPGGGVIAVFTLEGGTTFRVTDGPRRTVWPVASGDLVILRGRGWRTPEAMCPVHAVDPPVGGSRMIMTLRFNVGGAGAPYFT